MIDQLLNAIVASGVLTDPQADDERVFGKAHLPAAGTEVNVNVDPELEDEPDRDVGTLLTALERVLAMPSDTWRQIVDGIADEITQAVGSEQVIETTDLRDDLMIRSLDVFAELTLLCFAAPKQFPDSWIRVQLDEDFSIEDIIVDEKDSAEAERSFTSTTAIK